MDKMEEKDMVFSVKGPSHWEKDALSERQKAEMARIMFDVNSDDERYLRGHPEVEYIIAAVVMAAVENPPQDAVRFAVEYLSGDSLKERVMKQTESYRLSELAKKRLHELEYGGIVPRFTELDLAAGRVLSPNPLANYKFPRPKTPEELPAETEAASAAIEESQSTSAVAEQPVENSGETVVQAAEVADPHAPPFEESPYSVAVPVEEEPAEIAGIEELVQLAVPENPPQDTASVSSNFDFYN